MKLQQYIKSFAEPLCSEDPRPLFRLLDVRNKTARGLSDTVGSIDVSFEPCSNMLNAYVRHLGPEIAESPQYARRAVGRDSVAALRLRACALHQQLH